MKKYLLINLVALLFISLNLKAQETEIYYPDLRYATEARGFTIHNVTFESSIEAELWKRSTSYIPAESELGYTRTGEQTSIAVKGYDATNYYATETYAVITSVDLSANSAINDYQVTFFNMAQYGKVNFAEFSVLITTNFTGDPTTTTWTDVTDQLDQLDDYVDYDSNWTKSTLSLNAWKGESAVVLAFKYKIANTGTVDSSTDRPGIWRVAEVRFTQTTKELTNVMDWQFDDFNTFEMINVTSANAQGWKRTEALRTGLVEPVGEDYKSLQASAVYDADGLKNVSPTETWAVLNTVDLTGYEKAYLSFWNISQYKIGGDSDMTIKMSTDYVPNESDPQGAVGAATWADITNAFVLDESLGYDSNWTESIGEVSVDANNPDVTFAFVYKCTDTYEDVNGVNSDYRASTWKIGDVKVDVEPLPTNFEESKHENEVCFYPNPVNDIINFTSQVASVELYNMNGSMVKYLVNPGQHQNVSDLTKGIYVIKLKLDSGEIQVNKFIKQ